MHIPCFALLTDFGFDFAVASMKARILSALPTATIVDLDHSLHKFSIISGAFILGKTYDYFPVGTIFICIVDPGVGSVRRPLCVKTEKYLFFGPDNGLFHLIFEKNPSAQVFAIDEHFFAPESNTFHGRDLFVPAATLYAQGQHEFLKPIAQESCVKIEDMENHVAYIDSFGNIKTTISADPAWNNNYGKNVFIQIHERHYTIPFVKTFADVAVGKLFCYRGSNDTFEIAVNQNSAAKELKCSVGDYVSIQWPTQ